MLHLGKLKIKNAQVSKWISSVLQEKKIELVFLFNWLNFSSTKKDFFFFKFGVQALSHSGAIQILDVPIFKSIETYEHTRVHTSVYGSTDCMAEIMNQSSFPSPVFFLSLQGLFFLLYPCWLCTKAQPEAAPSLRQQPPQQAWCRCESALGAGGAHLKASWPQLHF